MALPPSTSISLSDHVIGGAILFPGVCQLEIALASREQIYGLHSIVIIRPYVLSEDGMNNVLKFTLEVTGAFIISSCANQEGGTFVSYASGVHHEYEG